MPTKSQQRTEIQKMIVDYQNNPDDEHLQTMIISNYERLVGALAAKFAKNSDVREDLYQVGMMGLIAAMKRFDPSVGGSFESFAIPTIIGEIKRYIRDKTWSVHVPRRVKELSPKIRKTTEQLTRELQRSPRIDEIADAVGESEEVVLETLEMAQGYHTLSVDSKIDGDAEGSAVTLLDIVGKPEQGYEHVHKKLILREAFRFLTQRERDILTCTYFENLSQKETGERLGISQMHVSRLQRNALCKLRNILPHKEEIGLSSHK
ncbi:RNA polymerase sigma factor SigB [Sporolactobacillus terrae]|uniref:RNA polymerase sigma factor SigB n=1 Tax=Sporolactobacillus terrae TaxID=269673 RepID=A0A410DBT4_9BACL|nr:RNA polymerase sigma factor SigB [Sporolactobacillus terrae]QAA23558.1 RNA polymerase sigma factor SigB [Sporolactobacillus terrae]QAA26528.1 RNA polymerase sigma factor SigB [Sporolactobacillus terrae]UAK15603.1 RNA polymerase sigma factor SigB [Sporolactobacillus terrae]BBO00062.1 RNA polymerase sigma-B factor [Sporolactobacillus terrae]